MLTFDDIMADVLVEPEPLTPAGTTKSKPVQGEILFPMNLEQLRTLKKLWGMMTEHKMDKNWCLCCDQYSYEISPETGSPVLWCSQDRMMVASLDVCPAGKWVRQGEKLSENHKILIQPITAQAR